METSEVLNRAADHIQRYGHSIGRAHGEGMFRTAPACMIGAIGVATIDDESAHDLDNRALDALRSYLPWGATIPGWSDSHAAAEVIEVLRACALIESAREEQAAAWETYAESVSS